MWFPEWALEREIASPGEPLVIVEGQPARVVAGSSSVLALGVEIGMLRRQAEALAPSVTVLERDRGEEARRFEQVVVAIEEVVPRVEASEPGLAFVPVEGALRYYGGEEPLVQRVSEVVPEGGRLGVADGPWAARQAAERARPGQPFLVEDTPGFLAELEVSTLGPEELVETFRWLGVSTLGALAALPRSAVASRFGVAGLEAHRLAAGEDRPVRPRSIPIEAAVESSHDDEPLVMADQVAFVARGLAARMLTALRHQGTAPYRVTVEVEAADGSIRRRVWRSIDPFTEQAVSERVWWQMKAWMSSPGGVPGGVARLLLDPSDLSDEGRQLPMLEQVGSTWQEVEEGRHDTDRALSRAQVLVGPDGVLASEPRGGRMPHERVRWFQWGEARPPSEQKEPAPWPGQTPSPNPALVSSRPPPVEVEWDGGMPVRIRLGSRWEPVLTWSGPWRLVGRWWSGEPVADRYQIVTSVGAVLCVVVDNRSFLAGVYD
ncbi:DNA polymerase Y family protein [soil metagenome]